MSRLLYKGSVVIDLISAYPPEIPSDISFFFPGTSSVPQYLNVEPILYQDETFQVHQVQNSLKILVKNNRIRVNIKQLAELPIFGNSLTSQKLSVLIGIMNNSKNEFDDIQDSVLVLFDLAEILIGSRENCTIIIASLNEFSKRMINTFKVHKDCEVKTFINNKDMRIDLYDKINCKYCNEIPCEAYVTHCCSTLYCENCKKSLKNCFDCNLQNIQPELEEFFTRFLKNVNYKCKCGENFTCNTIKNHAFSCELTIYKCKVEECKFEGSQAELVAHAIQKHIENIISKPPDQRIISEKKKECFKCMNFMNTDVCKNCLSPSSFDEILRTLSLNDQELDMF